MPFFLFMVGVSLGLVYKSMSCRAAASRKAIFRAVKLLVLGLFLQGYYFHGINNLTYGVDMEHIRWMGILQRPVQRIEAAAMCEIWLINDKKVRSGPSLIKKYQWHWIMVFLLTSMYLVLSYAIYAPDFEFQIPYDSSSEAKIYMVKCGVRGDTGPACNAAGMIDCMILGVKHLYRKPIYARTEQCSINSPDYGPLPPNASSWCQDPFDPEGYLSTVMAIVTFLIGLQYGHIIAHFKDHKRRLLLWLVPSSSFIVVGLLCDIFGMHINKALYSFSYMCVTTGVAGILLAAIYLVVDVYGYRRLTMVLEWMGMHALLIYIKCTRLLIRFDFYNKTLLIIELFQCCKQGEADECGLFVMRHMLKIIKLDIVDSFEKVILINQNHYHFVVEVKSYPSQFALIQNLSIDIL
ncbi:hepaRaN-alpha-glucosaminide n-acetyltransferase [Phtheirospermum japonicum]|uniref:HepaRaN-alpha-glucosaminide n-acetyltransferase n=1 Tax=Phtheirospermum japonicum TaxID=374723 RepID=A0A830CHM0_9LAMI|nr:hepaRaN-alpha-glucosaminide n-acetyltransferase [Phtheirospermum japonicum]